LKIVSKQLKEIGASLRSLAEHGPQKKEKKAPTRDRKINVKRNSNAKRQHLGSPARPSGDVF
jgi:hypothetical protein